jgi:hypothetical protein
MVTEGHGVAPSRQQRATVCQECRRKAAAGRGRRLGVKVGELGIQQPDKLRRWMPLSTVGALCRCLERQGLRHTVAVAFSLTLQLFTLRLGSLSAFTSFHKGCVCYSLEESQGWVANYHNSALAALPYEHLSCLCKRHKCSSPSNARDLAIMESTFHGLSP